MKIIFPASKAKLDAILDPKFGRAAGFVLYNDEDQSLKYIENANKNDGHGVGIQAAQTVIESGAEMVVTSGPFGPKATEVLQQAGLKLKSQVGEISIKEAIKKIS